MCRRKEVVGLEQTFIYHSQIVEGVLGSPSHTERCRRPKSVYSNPIGLLGFLSFHSRRGAFRLTSSIKVWSTCRFPHQGQHSCIFGTQSSFEILKWGFPEVDRRRPAKLVLRYTHSVSSNSWRNFLMNPILTLIVKAAHSFASIMTCSSLFSSE
jgi:hypothetical protein